MILAASSSLLAVSSCYTSQEATTTPVVTGETMQIDGAEEKPVEYEDGGDGRTSVNPTYNGIIRDKSSTEGCEFVIEAKIDGKEMLLVPVHLRDEFKVDGKKVTFNYSMSRRPSKCTLGTPIILGTIK